MRGQEGPEPLSPGEAAVRSGWPQALLEDPRKQPRVVEDAAAFLAFLCYADHSQAQLCVLRGGVRKLGLEGSLPSRFLEACGRHRDAVDCGLATIEEDIGGWGDGLDGDVFWWPPGECRRETVRHGSLRCRLLQCRKHVEEGGLAYIAELSHDRKTPHHLTGERCRVLTTRDVKDCVGGRLPLWDRGHCFLGAEGAGSCMHVDQAWWSNVGKNFLGQKLVALWPPERADAALAACAGELFRRPLSDKQRAVLADAARVALLSPGDVAAFTGGLPHVTSVVGDALNLTAYESFVNWNPANLELLLRGAARPREKGVMALGPLHGLLDDVVDAVKACAAAGGLPACAVPPSCGRCPEELLWAVRLALLQRPRCAKRLLGEQSCALESTDASSSASSGSSPSSPPAEGQEPSDVVGAAGAAAVAAPTKRREAEGASAARRRPRDGAAVAAPEEPPCPRCKRPREAIPEGGTCEVL